MSKLKQKFVGNVRMAIEKIKEDSQQHDALEKAGRNPYMAILATLLDMACVWDDMIITLIEHGLIESRPMSIRVNLNPEDYMEFRFYVDTIQASVTIREERVCLEYPKPT